MRRVEKGLAVYSMKSGCCEYLHAFYRVGVLASSVVWGVFAACWRGRLVCCVCNVILVLLLLP